MCEETESLTLEDLFNSKDINSCSSCYVKDVLGEKVKIIFILESPEKEEVRQKVPAVGNSGKSMSRQFFDWENDKDVVGLGRLINDNDEDTLSFGILNVSNYPLQCRNLSEYLRTSISDNGNPLNRLKNMLNPNKTSKEEKYRNKYPVETGENKTCFDLLTDIYQQFRIRMNTIKNKQNIVFIPCGNFARAFFEYYLESLYLDNDKKRQMYPAWANKIPHPSYNGWNKKEDKVAINIMLLRIRIFINKRNTLIKFNKKSNIYRIKKPLKINIAELVQH